VRYPHGLDHAVLYGRPFSGALFSDLLLPTHPTEPGSAHRSDPAVYFGQAGIP
ncbi:uncharacterized protein METZ01_LOCUS105267, partial [marine metagenome]